MILAVLSILPLLTSRRHLLLTCLQCTTNTTRLLRCCIFMSIEMAPPLFTLSTVLLTLSFPCFLLALYRLIIIIICSCCGTNIQGIVVSKQTNAITSCFWCHSTHKMMLHPNSTTNIEVWIAYHQGNYDWHMTMVEMPHSTYIAWPRGTKVRLRFCKTRCCYRAEPILTCHRCCCVLAWDRAIDVLLLLCNAVGVFCFYYALALQQSHDLECIGCIAIPISGAALFLTCCCYFNCCFLRKNPYPQHVEEVVSYRCESLLQDEAEEVEEPRRPLPASSCASVELTHLHSRTNATESVESVSRPTFQSVSIVKNNVTGSE